MSRFGAPRFSRWILERAAHVLATPDLPDAAVELFERRLRRDGRRAARRWYRRQARAALLRVIATAARHLASGPRGLGLLRREVALGFRRIRRAPALAASFAVLVGTGMGATAFMVQVRSAVLEPDLGLGPGIFLAHWTDSSGRTLPSVSLSGREAWLTDPSASAGRLVPAWPTSAVLATPHGLIRATGQRVGGGFLTELGAAPALGRDLAQVGDVVLSHRLWDARWEGDPAVVGSELEVDGRSGRIVGVAAPGFDGPLCCAPPEFWLVGEPGEVGSTAVLALARPPDPLAAAAWLGSAARESSEGARVTVAPAESAPYGGDAGIVGQTLSILLALAVAALLGTLVGGANLLLADTLDRTDELRLRRALGSPSGSLVLRAATECGWLAVLAATFSVGVAWLLVEAAPWFLPLIDGVNAVEVVIGREIWQVVAAATVMATVACAMPAGAVGTALARRVPLRRGPSRSRLSSIGLVLQVALAGGLLVATAIFVGTIRNLDGDFVGFRNGSVQLIHLSPGPGTPAPTADEMLASIESVEGIGLPALTRRGLVFGGRVDSVEVAPGRRERAVVDQVTPGFFRTVGTRLVSGEAARTADEAVVSADLVDAIGVRPSGAVGRFVTVGDSTRVRITGVVEAATWGSGAVRPTVYVGWGPEPVPSALLLTAGAGVAGSPALARALRSPGVAVQPYATLDQLLVRSRILSVFLARLALVFGALCTLVGAAGIHAHLLRWVRARQREMGIRAAIGAPAPALRGHVLGAGLRLVVPGAVLGCGIAWLSAWLGEFGRPGPTVPLGALALLLAVALLAMAAPLWKASAADPLALLDAG